MLFMNQWDIEDAVRWAEAEDDPVMIAATRTLRNLMDWTNRNSDGWAYWPKPVRAAKRLQELIQAHHPFRSQWLDPVTVAEYKVALRPIKAFRTRQGADFEIVEAAA